MRADVKKHGDVFIVSIAGPLQIEETQPLREACRQKLMGEKLVFNMADANFVGSTGIQPFLEMIKLLDEKGAHGVKLVGVKPEFRRLIANLEVNHLQFFDCERSAIAAFNAPAPQPQVQMALINPASAEQPEID
jgi:anti-anti-sigma factor